MSLIEMANPRHQPRAQQLPTPSPPEPFPVKDLPLSPSRLAERICPCRTPDRTPRLTTFRADRSSAVLSTPGGSTLIARTGRSVCGRPVSSCRDTTPSRDARARRTSDLSSYRQSFSKTSFEVALERRTYFSPASSTWDPGPPLPLLASLPYATLARPGRSQGGSSSCSLFA